MLKAFDIHCRILLTTRNRSVTDAVGGMNPVLFNIHMQIHFNIKMEINVVAVKHVLRVHIFKHFFGGSKYEVEVESGLDEHKALEILALYTETKAHGLPEEAQSIVRECKGW